MACTSHVIREDGYLHVVFPAMSYDARTSLYMSIPIMYKFTMAVPNSIDGFPTTESTAGNESVGYVFLGQVRASAGFFDELNNIVNQL